jgi:hypothetical protein
MPLSSRKGFLSPPLEEQGSVVPTGSASLLELCVTLWHSMCWHFRRLCGLPHVGFPHILNTFFISQLPALSSCSGWVQGPQKDLWLLV